MLKSIVFEGSKQAVQKSQVEEVINRLIDISGCSTVAELARVVKFNPSVFSAMRSGNMRLKRDDLQRIAQCLSCSFEDLCVLICGPAHKNAKKNRSNPQNTRHSLTQQRMSDKRYAFLRYCQDAHIDVDQSEEESIIHDGCVLPSLLTRIFATGNQDHINYLIHSQPLMTDHHVREIQIDNVPSHASPSDEDDDDAVYADAGDEDNLNEATDNDPEADQEVAPLSSQEKVSRRKNGCHADCYHVQQSSDTYETPEMTIKITSHTTLFQMGHIILSTAIKEAINPENATVSITAIRRSITAKIPHMELRYDPNDSRITLIDDDVELATSAIPPNHVFVE